MKGGDNVNKLRAKVLSLQKKKNDLENQNETQQQIIKGLEAKIQQLEADNRQIESLIDANCKLTNELDDLRATIEELTEELS